MFQISLLQKVLKDKNRILFATSIILLNFCFFFLIGEKGYIEMQDTSSYCIPNLTQGVMPVYPFFLNICRILSGEKYLDTAAMLQGWLAVFSVTIFLFFLKKKFALRYWEIYLLWVAVVLPYAIELPEYVLTHVIYTEAIAYSLFYIFAIFSLNAIWKRDFKWFWMSVCMALFMGLIRPQLMLVFILNGLLLIYLFLTGQKGNIFVRLLIGVAASAIIILAGVLGTFKIRSFYIEKIETVFEQKWQSDPGLFMQMGEEESGNKREEIIALMQQNDTFAQVGSALICRAFYEAEADDYKYYADKNMQEIFIRIYQKCDQRQILFPYAKHGLWMWEDLTQTDIYIIASQEIGGFLEEKYPSMDITQYQKEITRIKIAIALKEIQLHFGRFLYHCIRLMIPGFIGCIFFNIEAVYLLCHILVLFLYISAFVMGVYVLHNKRPGGDAAKFMLASLISCIVFVGVVNAIFFGMQRYFIYNMGIFYCAYYLVLRVIFMELVQKCMNNQKK